LIGLDTRAVDALRVAGRPVFDRVPVRVTLPVSALLFAMQVVYRSIQLMRDDVPRDQDGH